MGNERLFHLIIPGFVISGDNHLLTLLGTASLLRARGFRCGRPVLASLVAAVISRLGLRGFAGTVGGKSPAGLEGWGPSALPWDLADASGKVSHL